MSSNTPNMGLGQPTIGVDTGLTWENTVNNNSAIIDSHTHTPGQGLPIPPDGLNINADLSFQNNAAKTIKAVIFTTQSSYTTLGSIYQKGSDLYFNDLNGNVIQITSGGTVNATSSGISSGTATASFVGGVLVVNAASTTPANIQGGSVLLGNNVANSKYLTLAPPAAMAANITETLPAIPSAASFMQIDTSGNMSATVNTSGGITGSNIASATVTNSNLAPVNSALSSASGVWVQSAGSFGNPTNLLVTLTTIGRPVSVELVPEGGTNYGYLLSNASGSDIIVQFSRDSSIISHMQFGPGSSNGVLWPPTMLSTIDTSGSAGTFTYSILFALVTPGGGRTFTVGNCRLLVREL